MLYLPPLETLVQEITSSLAVNASTTSASWVDLLSHGITTAGNSYLFIASSFSTSSSAATSGTVSFRITIDGIDPGQAGDEVYNAPEGGAICAASDLLSPGAHTVALQWRISDGTTLRCRPVGYYEHATLLTHEVSY
jgi:hypothetical protein